MGDTQTGTNRTDTSNVPATPPFKLKTYFTALAGRDSLQLSRAWSGSIVLPGYIQAYNRQYWKIPLIYAGMGTGFLLAHENSRKYKETEDDKYATYRNLCYLGAGLFYWGGMLDGVASYKSPIPYLPARATLYSALLPGLGQIYNGDYWKLPVIYGGLATCFYFLQFNNMQYKRYKVMYNRATDGKQEYNGWLTPDNIKWYRDTYRRYRDYSILATLAVYVINIIDANVFAHFQDFDISDDLSFNFSPGIIPPLESRMGLNTATAYGLQCNIIFK